MKLLVITLALRRLKMLMITHAELKKLQRVIYIFLFSKSSSTYVKTRRTFDLGRKIVYRLDPPVQSVAMFDAAAKSSVLAINVESDDGEW